jgi:hypothetical protein
MMASSIAGTIADLPTVSALSGPEPMMMSAMLSLRFDCRRWATPLQARSLRRFSAEPVFISKAD